MIDGQVSPGEFTDTDVNVFSYLVTTLKIARAMPSLKNEMQSRTMPLLHNYSMELFDNVQLTTWTKYAAEQDRRYHKIK